MKKTTFLTPLALILFFGFACHVSALEEFNITYWVSPDGNDANPGTAAQPFATLQKAVDAPLPEGETRRAIGLKRGVYFLTEPVRVKTSVRLLGERGTSPDEPSVTLSGGRKVTGFKEIEKGLVVAEIPEVKAGKWDFRDLYVNGEQAIRARSPNSGYFRIEKSGEDRRTNFIYNEGDLKNWKDLANVELVFLHDWSITRCPIKEVNEKERRLTVPHRIGCDLDFFKIDGWEPHPRYFVENSIEFLDAPGEWFLDTKEGKLFYRLKEGESADALDVVAPVATQLLVFEGTPEQKISGYIGNIRFAHAAYVPRPGNTIWEGQAAACSSPGDQGIAAGFIHSPAAVHFEYVSEMTVRNGVFEHLGENGLWFSKGCSKCSVYGSQFRDIGANGVMIGTCDHANTVEECLVSDSLVEQTGKTIYGAIGIWIGIARKIDLRGNIVRQAPYGGISCGWQWNPAPSPAGENSIRYNLIYDCMRELSDSGGIYTLGFQPDSVIEGNIIHGIPQAAGRAESNGMFLDEGTKGFTIKNNIVYDTAQSSLRFHRADTNIVKDNILSNDEGIPMIRYNATPEENLERSNNRDLKPDSSEFLEAVKKLEQLRAGVPAQ